MSNFEQVFKSCSDVMSREMDRYIDSIGQDKNEEIQDSDIEKVLESILGKWLDTPLAEAEGRSPREIILGIGTLEEAVEAFRSFLTIGEGIVPDVLRIKLEEFGEAAQDKLLDILFCEDETFETNENEDFQPYFYVKQGIINLLGVWKAEKGIPALVQVIRNSNEKDEFLAEAAVKAIAEIGVPAVQALIDEAEASSGNTLIDILDALTLIGSKSKDNRVFPVIKEYFLSNDNRDMALVFFVQLNDSRAITFLRGYIEKNANKIAYREYTSLKSCIEELGGTIDDIVVDFKNDPEYLDYLKMVSKYRKTSEEKTGRNETCPCGSGKKYKKCCGK